eukprot:g1031.t1
MLRFYLIVVVSTRVSTSRGALAVLDWKEAVERPILPPADDYGQSRWPSALPWTYSPFTFFSHLKNLTLAVMDILVLDEKRAEAGAILVDLQRTGYKFLLPEFVPKGGASLASLSGPVGDVLPAGESAGDSGRAQADTDHGIAGKLASRLFKILTRLLRFWYDRCVLYPDKNAKENYEKGFQNLNEDLSNPNSTLYQQNVLWVAELLPALEAEMDLLVADADAEVTTHRSKSQEGAGRELPGATTETNAISASWNLPSAFARSYRELFRRGCVNRHAKTKQLQIVFSCYVHEVGYAAESIFFQTCLHPLVAALQTVTEGLRGWVQIAKHAWLLDHADEVPSQHGGAAPKPSDVEVAVENGALLRTGFLPAPQLTIPSWRGHDMLGVSGLVSTARWSQILRVAQERLKAGGFSRKPLIGAQNLARSLTVTPGSQANSAKNGSTAFWEVKFFEEAQALAEGNEADSGSGTIVPLIFGEVENKEKQDETSVKRFRMLEVGVFTGNTMLYLLKHLRRHPEIRYYALDPYEAFREDYRPLGKHLEERATRLELVENKYETPRFTMIKDGIALEQESKNQSCERVRKRILDDVTKAEGDSVSSDEKPVLDLIFLDACGDNGMALAQLRCLLPLLKRPTGMVGGHDFGPKNILGIKIALEEWHREGQNGGAGFKKGQLELRTRPDAVWWLTFSDGT